MERILKSYLDTLANSKAAALFSISGAIGAWTIINPVDDALNFKQFKADCEEDKIYEIPVLQLLFDLRYDDILINISS